MNFSKLIKRNVSNSKPLKTSKICPKETTFCNKDHKFSQEKFFIYQEAILISNNDPRITVEDALNKGFAYLEADKETFWWSAFESFRNAEFLDKQGKYKEEIECGIKQSKQKGGKKCYCVFINNK